LVRRTADAGEEDDDAGDFWISTNGLSFKVAGFPSSCSTGGTQEESRAPALKDSTQSQAASFTEEMTCAFAPWATISLQLRPFRVSFADSTATLRDLPGAPRKTSDLAFPASAGSQDSEGSKEGKGFLKIGGDFLRKIGDLGGKKGRELGSPRSPERRWLYNRWFILCPFYFFSVS
jgi:hypothetical protein